MEKLATEGKTVEEPVKPKFDLKFPTHNEPKDGCLYNLSVLTLFLLTPMLVLGAIPSIFSQEGDMGGAVIPLILLISVAFIIVKSHLKNLKDEKNKFEQEKKAYYKNKKTYGENLKEWKKKYSKYLSESARLSKLSKHERIREGLKSYFSELNQPSTVHFDYKKGNSEKYLYNVLIQYFGDKIKRDHAIITDDYDEERPYMPDLVYNNENNGICIDIEVDEKFEKENLAPIHYLGSKHDEYRDFFFNSNGWIVLRLAESQVLNSPTGCAKELLKIVKKYDPDFILNEKVKSLEDETEIMQVSKWTIEDVKNEIEKT